MMKVDEKGLRSSAAPSAYVSKIRLSPAAMISSKIDTSKDNSTQIVKTKHSDGTTKYQPQDKPLDILSSTEAVHAERKSP